MSVRMVLTLKLVFMFVDYFNSYSFISEEHLLLKSNLGSNPVLSLASHVTLDKLFKPQCLGF